MDERNSYKRALDEHNKVKARQDQLNFELYCNRKISDFLSESAERIESVQRTLQDSRRSGPNSPGFLPSLQNIEQQLRGHMNACDLDDVVCWEKTGGNLKVYLVHDFSSLGWEKRKEYSDFWAWYHQAIDDMIEHDQPYR